MKNSSIIFVPSNENHVQVFWSLCRHIRDHRPVFVSSGLLKDEGAEEAMLQLGIKFARLDDYGNDPTFVLQKEEAGVVVVANDTNVVPQWFVNCAKKMGIPTVLIQDGILFDYKTINNRLSTIRLSRLKLLFTAFRLLVGGKYRRVPYGGAGCTKILVWGQSSKSYLVGKGIDEGRIVITGSTAVNIARNLPESDTDMTTVLYIPTDLVHGKIVKEGEAKAIMETVCSTILSFDNMKLIIKPHPREERAFYQHLRERYGPAVTVSYENVYDLMIKAGIVLTDISTAAAEALAAKKLVVIFLPRIGSIINPSSYPRDLISQRAVLYAEDEQALHLQINGLLTGTHTLSRQAAERMVESYFGPPGMDSLLSSAEAIESVLR